MSRHAAALTTALLIACAAGSAAAVPKQHGARCMWRTLPAPKEASAPDTYGPHGGLTGSRPDDDEVFAVDAVSKDDLWAVGAWEWAAGNYGYAPLIEHWDGTRWSVVSPRGFPRSGSLNGVAAVSANDVWVVGSGGHRPLAGHWDGKKWSVVSSPRPTKYAGFTAVAGAGVDDVWAVGEYSQSGRSTSELIEHWDGRRWRIVSSPARPKPASLDSVAAAGIDDVWAVGESGSALSGGGPAQPLVEHWDGKQWRVVPTAAPAISRLSAVAADSPTDVWASGTQGSGSHERGFIEHWNGRAWKTVPSPSRGPTSLAVLSATNVWGASILSVEHWDGSRWRTFPSPGGGTDLTAVSADDIWVVWTQPHHYLCA
jgi:hypothetical protein